MDEVKNEVVKVVRPTTTVVTHDAKRHGQGSKMTLPPTRDSEEVAVVVRVGSTLRNDARGERVPIDRDTSWIQREDIEECRKLGISGVTNACGVINAEADVERKVHMR